MIDCELRHNGQNPADLLEESDKRLMPIVATGSSKRACSSDINSMDSGSIYSDQSDFSESDSDDDLKEIRRQNMPLTMKARR